MLPSEVPRLTTDSPVRVFPGVWKLLFFKTPFPGQISFPTSFVSLFIFYSLSYLLSKTMGCLSGCLMSSASIQNLCCGICSAFKCFFDEFVEEKVVSLSYSSTILGPSLQSLLFPIFLLFHSSLILLVSPLHMYYTFCNCHTVLGYSAILFLHSFLFFFFS